MNKSVWVLMLTNLKKRGMCSSPLLARIFLLSLCFSSTSSFFLSVSCIFPSSRSLKTQSTLKTDDLKKNKKKINCSTDLLCFVYNQNRWSNYLGFINFNKINSLSGPKVYVCLSSSIIKGLPLVRSQACICRGQQGLKVRSQLIHFHCKAREAIVQQVVLWLWICKEAQTFWQHLPTQMYIWFTCSIRQNSQEIRRDPFYVPGLIVNNVNVS